MLIFSPRLGKDDLPRMRDLTSPGDQSCGHNSSRPVSEHPPSASPDVVIPRVLLRAISTMAGTSKAFIPFLIAMMLLTGVCNTLLTKYQVRPPEHVLAIPSATNTPSTGQSMRTQLPRSRLLQTPEL